MGVIEVGGISDHVKRGRILIESGIDNRGRVTLMAGDSLAFKRVPFVRRHFGRSFVS
jgi:hypothetical protein